VAVGVGVAAAGVEDITRVVMVTGVIGAVVGGDMASVGAGDGTLTEEIGIGFATRGHSLSES
jgi:putative effector of murein hydrolase